MSRNDHHGNALPCDAMTWERLVTYLDGELTGRDHADAERHVEACAHCTREADLLRRSGAMIERLPRLTPGDAFTERVLARVAAGEGGGADEIEPAGPAPEISRSGGRVRPMWPWAAAAAAVLVAAIAARVWWPAGSEADRVLSAREEREIAADLYILANLDALEESEAAELISLVEHLDLLEGTETEVSGLFGDLDGDGDESPNEGG